MGQHKSVRTETALQKGKPAPIATTIQQQGMPEIVFYVGYLALLDVRNALGFETFVESDILFRHGIFGGLMDSEGNIIASEIKHDVHQAIRDLANMTEREALLFVRRLIAEGVKRGLIKRGRDGQNADVYRLRINCGILGRPKPMSDDAYDACVENIFCNPKLAEKISKHQFINFAELVGKKDCPFTKELDLDVFLGECYDRGTLVSPLMESIEVVKFGFKRKPPQETRLQLETTTMHAVRMLEKGEQMNTNIGTPQNMSDEFNKFVRDYALMCKKFSMFDAVWSTAELVGPEHPFTTETDAQRFRSKGLSSGAIGRVGHEGHAKILPEAAKAMIEYATKLVSHEVGNVVEDQQVIARMERLYAAEFGGKATPQDRFQYDRHVVRHVGSHEGAIWPSRTKWKSDFSDAVQLKIVQGGHMFFTFLSKVKTTSAEIAVVQQEGAMSENTHQVDSAAMIANMGKLFVAHFSHGDNASNLAAKLVYADSIELHVGSHDGAIWPTREAFVNDMFVAVEWKLISGDPSSIKFIDLQLEWIDELGKLKSAHPTTNEVAPPLVIEAAAPPTPVAAPQILVLPPINVNIHFRAIDRLERIKLMMNTCHGPTVTHRQLHKAFVGAEKMFDTDSAFNSFVGKLGHDALLVAKHVRSYSDDDTLRAWNLLRIFGRFSGEISMPVPDTYSKRVEDRPSFEECVSHYQRTLAEQSGKTVVQEPEAVPAPTPVSDVVAVAVTDAASELGDLLEEFGSDLAPPAESGGVMLPAAQMIVDAELVGDAPEDHNEAPPSAEVLTPPSDRVPQEFAQQVSSAMNLIEQLETRVKAAENLRAVAEEQVELLNHCVYDLQSALAEAIARAQNAEAAAANALQLKQQVEQLLQERQSVATRLSTFLERRVTAAAAQSVLDS